MKIGFDGKRITQNYTGLGNYSRYVLQILAENHPENQYSVYALKPGEHSIDLQKYPSIHFHYPGNPILKHFWRTYGIVDDLKKAKIGLFHGLSNEIPMGLKKAGIPSVVTIHDLIFCRYPEYYPFLDRKIYEFKVRYACVNADKIIAISEKTKTDLINFFNVDEERIEVIYQNCSSLFRQILSDEEKLRIRSAYNLPQEFLLNVGTIETRKNLLLAVKALNELDSNIHLVIIGKETSYAKQVKEFVSRNGMNSRVHFLKNVLFKDLPGIYQQAKIFIYPSEFEGFGIPVIEALSSHIPVIAARGSCLEEAGGEGSIYIDPKDSSALAAQIGYVLKNPEKREVMISSGIAHLKKFSNDKIADKITDLYQNLL